MILGPRRALSILGTLLLLLVGLVGLVGLGVPSPAQAAERLCTGYASCAGSGHPHDGFAQRSQATWWNMTPGHNCTGYAAYRMVRSGMPNTRPWSGEGDAHRWGHEMARITDQVPRVGSVAWWDGGAGGRGPLGHVAYVERVVSPGVVVVSEDLYGGDFHWTRVTRGGGGWPSGFIHFNDARLRMRARPVVAGQPRVGRTLRATAGRWDRGVRVGYQWLADGRPVRAATRRTYTPTARQVRDRIRVRLTVRSSGYAPVVVTTRATTPVARGVLRVARPARVAGAAQVGRVVRVDLPRVAPRADRTRVRWRLADRVVPGARGREIRLGPEAVGRQLVAEVTAFRAGYEPRTVRVRAGRVRAGEIVVHDPAGVQGTPEVGQELRVVGGGTAPSDVQVTHLWLRGGEPIDGATGPSYVVTPDDAGHQLAVAVGLARSGYTPRSVTVVAGDVPAPERR